MISCIVAKTKVLKVSQNVKNIKFDKGCKIKCKNQLSSSVGVTVKVSSVGQITSSGPGQAGEKLRLE